MTTINESEAPVAETPIVAAGGVTRADCAWRGALIFAVGAVCFSLILWFMFGFQRAPIFLAFACCLGSFWAALGAGIGFEVHRLTTQALGPYSTVKSYLVLSLIVVLACVHGLLASPLIKANPARPEMRDLTIMVSSIINIFVICAVIRVAIRLRHLFILKPLKGYAYLLVTLCVLSVIALFGLLMHDTGRAKENLALYAPTVVFFACGTGVYIHIALLRLNFQLEPAPRFNFQFSLGFLLLAVWVLGLWALVALWLSRQKI